MRKKSKLPFIYLWIITILAYLPIVVAVVYSFNNSKTSSVWSGFTLKWYRKVLSDSSIISAVVNSIIIGLASAIFSSVIAVSGALAFKKRNVKLDSLIRQIQMIPLMVPEIISAVAYLGFFRLLHLKFGMLTLILGHMTFCVPYIFMQIESRIQSMDNQLADAARVMGAKPVKAFFDVTLPYLMPALVSGMFLSFAMSLDDVIISMFITGVNINTLSMKIYSQVKTSITPKVNALCTLLLAATVICMIIAGLFSRQAGEKNE